MRKREAVQTKRGSTSGCNVEMYRDTANSLNVKPTTLALIGFVYIKKSLFVVLPLNMLRGIPHLRAVIATSVVG